MKKLLLTFPLLWLYLSGFAQEIKKVTLISSALQKGYVTQGFTRIIKPVFSHEGSTLAADSANFNQSQNTFDAFGNVVITQSNGTSVYADLLNYNGNTRMALLTGNVRLVDGSATLTTDFLTYNMGTRIGTYTGGGKIVSGNDILTSKNGYYFANSNDAYFRYNVVANTPDALIKNDTLRYNTVTKTAFFYGPTNIYGKKDSTKLYTENGNYNTVTEQARFGKRNLYTEGTKSLKGDSLFYDGKAGIGRAINHITFTDTEQKVTLKGDLGLYKKIDESALVTKNAYVILTTEDNGKIDSIYMASDTLYTRMLPMKDFKPITYPQFGKDTGEQPAVQSNVPKDTISSVLDIPGKKKPVKKNAAMKDVVSGTLKAPGEPKPARDAVPEKIVPRTDSIKTGINQAEIIIPVKPSSSKNKDSIKVATVNKGIKDTALKYSSVKNGIQTGDTAKTRIVLAYRKVKLFKSDLQARADSIFYSYADSTLRCYVNPMIWTEGSQLSADTVYMQLKNRRMDNILLRQSAFIVNTEADSARFNQVKGKTITGIFKDSKMDRLFVDGNAESIYFTREDSAYSGMNHLISSRMRVGFANNKIRDMFTIKKPEGQYYPMNKIPKDKEILDGFIWKPKDRPRSKEEIIPSSAKPEIKPVFKPAAKSGAVEKKAGKNTVTGSSKKRSAP